MKYSSFLLSCALLFSPSLFCMNEVEEDEAQSSSSIEGSNEESELINHPQTKTSFRSRHPCRYWACRGTLEVAPYIGLIEAFIYIANNPQEEAEMNSVFNVRMWVFVVGAAKLMSDVIPLTGLPFFPNSYLGKE